MQIYCCKEEQLFPTIHECKLETLLLNIILCMLVVVINKSPQVILRTGDIKGKMSLFNGPYRELIARFPSLEKQQVTNKFDFPSDFINFEEQTRHDLYLTLESGEFSQVQHKYE